MVNDSTSVTPAPVKPVRIEHVADDVKLLKTSDVQQQATLLSGRAMKDFGSAVGFEFKSDGGYDEKYLTEGSIDFNKLTDTDVRFITADDSRVNGPDNITTGELTAIISTTAVLPNGTLTWDNNLAASRSAGGVTHLRQIYWPSDINEPGGYTRIGKRSSDSSEWEWSKWIVMSPDSTIRFLITDPNDRHLKNLLPSAIYELHCDGCNITLPSALSMKVGTVIGFEQYPNPAALKPADRDSKTGIYAKSWSSVVKYETPDPITDDHERIDYSVTLTSALDPINEATKNTGARGTWYENAHCGITYKFENVSVIPFTIDGTTYDRIWSLETDQDADQAVPELAELLDKHTDQTTGDFVGLNPEAGSEWNTTARTIARKADTRGLFKVEIEKLEGTLPNTFGIEAYLADESDVSIEYTEVKKSSSDDPDSLLDPNLTYYYHDEILDRKVLAGNAGTVTSWDEVDVATLYYKSDITVSAIATIWSSNDTTGKYGTLRDAKFFKTATYYNAEWFGNHHKFIGYVQANSGQIFSIQFKNESSISDVQDKLRVSVVFIPDPHDSYLHKEAVVDATGSTEDVERQASAPGAKVASAASVAASRDEIIGTLQSKGMFYGNVAVATNDLNNVTAPGVYTLGKVTNMSNVPPMIGGPSGIGDTDTITATLTVTSSKSYSPSKKKPGNDLKYTGDGAGPADSAGNTGFERITQIITAELLVNASDLSSSLLLPRMWLRHGILGSGYTMWSNWVHFEPGRTIHEFGPGGGATAYTGTGNNQIDMDTVRNLLAYGKPSIILHGPYTDEIDPADELPKITVNLPDPALYVNTTFQIEAVSNVDVEVKYTANGETYERTYSAATSPDHLLLNVECCNGLWYIVTA